MSAAERRYHKLVKEQMAFAERAHRRQMLGNVFTSMAQAMTGNRPMQVAGALGVLKLGQGVGAAIKGDRQWYERIADPVQDFALTAGMVAYLTNSDGGSSVQYDIPDVESPGGGAALSGGGFFLPPAAATTAGATRPRRR